MAAVKLTDNKTQVWINPNGEKYATAIPESASPGLVFMKHLMTEVDRLPPNADTFKRLASVDAKFVINDMGEMDRDAVLEALSGPRVEMLKGFWHDISRAWDVESEDGETRTVMLESKSYSAFKDDYEDMKPLKVPEFSVLELVKDEKGLNGWLLVKDITWMNEVTPFEQRQAEMKRRKEAGDS